MSFELFEHTGVLIGIVHSVLAIIAIVLALQMAKAMRGGSLAKTWSWLAFGVLTFGLFEINQLLLHAGIITGGMVGHLLEFLTIIAFILAFLFARKAFRQ